MNEISDLLPTPYYAVIFTSLLTDPNNTYDETAKRMVELASQQEGFLGVDSVRDDIGITVSYWKNLESISAWKANAEHLIAQKKGHEEWYKKFTIRISRVERNYGKV